jgi:hypothetical protein
MLQFFSKVFSPQASHGDKNRASIARATHSKRAQDAHSARINAIFRDRW